MDREHLYAIRQRVNERVSERPPLTFKGLAEDERERVRWAFQDRRDLLTEVSALWGECGTLREMLADLVETCQRQGAPDGAMLACARRVLSLFSTPA